jgi:membrane fusion protein (multidrug efflux system)
MQVIQRTTPVFEEFVGEIRGSREVDLRARVGGVLVRKHFEDGSLAKKGQVLFSIDPREYRAQLATARASLAEAQSALLRAQQDVDRYAPLVKENAISRQTYDNAVATAQQAKARVDATRASIDQANLSVEYATVNAPMAGRLGKSEVSEGALIIAGTTTLVTISNDNPAWAFFSISERQLLDVLHRSGGAAAAATKNARRNVTLTLSDGSAYPHEGVIDFTDRALDPQTGTFRLRASFSNPDHLLRPGLYAKVRVRADVAEQALLIPERSVQEQLGRQFVTVVGAGDKAETRPVTLGPRADPLVIVQSGLTTADRVVVEGLLRAQPGAPLKPAPITEAELTRAADVAAQPRP